MTIADLHLFREVGLHDSLRKAARSLFLAEPTVGLRIRRLEEELGVRLLDRSPSGVALTPEGQLWWELSGYLLDQYREMVDALHEAARPPRRLRIGATPALATSVLGAAMNPLLERLGVDLDVTPESPTGVVRGVLCGLFTVGIVSRYRPVERLRHHSIAGTPLLAVQHQSRQVALPMVEQIRDSLVLAPRVNSEAWQHLEQFWRLRAIRPQRVVHLSKELIKTALRSRPDALGILPRYALTETDRDLEVVPWDDLAPPPVPVYLIWPRRSLSPPEARLVDELLALAPTLCAPPATCAATRAPLPAPS